MNMGGDAAEQVVRLSLEGFEVAAKLTGSAAKNIAVLLASALKKEISQSNKTKGKARLTGMIKSGKELKVFAIPQKDVKTFTQQAKRYGVLYCVLRDRKTDDKLAPVDIIARAEDASKIQRIVDRFELGKVDRASIVGEAQKNISDREETAKDVPVKSRGEVIVEKALKDPPNSPVPFAEQTDKDPPSEKRFANSKDKEKPSVREKIERFKSALSAQKNSGEPKREVRQKSSAPSRETVHRQPKKDKKKKER